MQEGDLVKIDLLVEHSGSRKSKEAWSRIKKDFEELAQQTHNSARNASCANCRKNIDDDHCSAGGWYGEGSCKLWAPRNQHP